MGIRNTSDIKLLRKSTGNSSILSGYPKPAAARAKAKVVVIKNNIINPTIVGATNLSELATGLFENLSYAKLMESGKKIRLQLKTRSEGFEDYPDTELNADERSRIYTLCKQWIADNPNGNVNYGHVASMGTNGGSEWSLAMSPLARGIISVNILRELKSKGRTRTSMGHFNIEVDRFTGRDELNITPFSSVTAVTLMLGILGTSKHAVLQKGHLF